MTYLHVTTPIEYHISYKWHKLLPSLLMGVLVTTLFHPHWLMCEPNLCILLLDSLSVPSAVIILSVTVWVGWHHLGTCVLDFIPWAFSFTFEEKGGFLGVSGMTLGSSSSFFMTFLFITFHAGSIKMKFRF